MCAVTHTHTRARARARAHTQNSKYSACFGTFLDSCSSTQRETSVWWAVDLGTERHITRVIINNRLDCCSECCIWFVVPPSPPPCTCTVSSVDAAVLTGRKSNRQEKLRLSDFVRAYGNAFCLKLPSPQYVLAEVSGQLLSQTCAKLLARRTTELTSTIVFQANICRASRRQE